MLGGWLHVAHFLLSDDSQKASALQGLSTMRCVPTHISQKIRINILFLINVLTISHMPSSVISSCTPFANATIYNYFLFKTIKTSTH